MSDLRIAGANLPRSIEMPEIHGPGQGQEAAKSAEVAPC